MTNSTDLLTPNGTYIIMNAATHTYLNVLSYGGPGTAIVCSVGNDLGNDIWNYMTTQNNGVTLQNFGTAGFAASMSTKQLPIVSLPSGTSFAVACKATIVGNSGIAQAYL
ncbi:hypothetical protein SCLCIDRAFT_935573 [Scleroderma citrinum Foug A]|uniref:Ricin B lectin domain-containing protein n=1 Tax=Scleroderma citrinum Foug A TaxID=1036808 RepID=A0A0C3A6X1_9AGAM|nr:hypothetical protein SCLCIDRAFT_935573 [Scleroderma citrinum Foug A]